jgi:low affinity Fe/Cu permease
LCRSRCILFFRPPSRDRSGQRLGLRRRPARHLVWLITGPTFHFSDTWQLIINTARTIITFLMVFLIQNTQNRGAKAVHLKLDELIRAMKGARNKLVDLENLSEEELRKLEDQFQRLRKKAEHDGTHSHDAEPLVTPLVSSLSQSRAQKHFAGWTQLEHFAV